MKKLALFALAAVILLSGFSSCRSMHARGKGPIESFAFLAAKNPELPQNVVGSIIERAEPKEIVLVVPPGTFVRSLIATISLNTEATITVISTGSPVVQKNGVTPNDFSAPLLYSVEVPGEKEPWEYRVSVREADTDATLASLSIPEGPRLVPAFSPSVQSYRVEVPFASRTVRLEARAQSRYLRNITVDGRANPGSSATVEVEFAAGRERSVSIETLAEDGVSTQRYTILIQRGEPDRNPNLASLEVQGATLAPAFSPGRYIYKVEVPYDTAKFVILAPAQSAVAVVALRASDPAAPPLQFKGDPAAKAGAGVDFAGGERLSMTVAVTAQDGSTQEYRVEVQRAEPDRNSLLAGLNVPGGSMTPAFAANRVAYVVAVPFSSQTLTIAARPQSRFAKIALGPASADQSAPKVEGDVAAADGARVDFKAGDRLPLMVTVTAQDSSERAYVLEIRRSDPDSNANLASLKATEGVLVPAFSPRTVSYLLSVPANSAGIQITAAAESPVAAVGVLDDPAIRPVATQTLSIGPGQSPVISFIATAEDGTQKLYRVAVKREAPQAVQDSNAQLMGLQVLGVRMEPDFSPSVSSYSAVLPASLDAVTLAALPQSPAARVLVDGQPLEPAGRKIAIAAGYTRIVQIEVRAEDGKTARYTVQLTRQAAGSSTPQSPAEDQTKAPAGPPEFGGGAARLIVEAKNLRLGDRELGAVAAAGDSIGAQAEVTVRYYRSSTVIARQMLPVSSRQQGKSWTVTLSLAAADFTVEYGRLVEVETAIKTTRGSYLYYTEALAADRELKVEVPFLLYGKDPRVRWPALGTRVPVTGYASLLPPGHTRGQKGSDREDFPKNDKGEYGITVELSDPAGGRLLGKDTVWSRPGLARGYTFAFKLPLELPEGTAVQYLLSARARNGRVWQSSGTTTVWTTMIEHNGGFKPAVLYLFDDLTAAGQ